MFAYKGYLFDRVCDFRWAVVLDAVCFNWEYDRKRHLFTVDQGFGSPPTLVFIGDESLFDPEEDQKAICVFGDFTVASDILAYRQGLDNGWEYWAAVDYLLDLFQITRPSLVVAFDIARKAKLGVRFV